MPNTKLKPTPLGSLLFTILLGHCVRLGMPDLHTLDCARKKVGILSLSAIKLSQLVQAQYSVDQLSPARYSSVSDFLHDAGYVADNYREWLESADVQVLPLLFFNDLDSILSLMDSLDGFVLTGGSESFFAYEGEPSVYLNTVEQILHKAKQINDSGREFPIWGTCLGFEAMLVAESGRTLKRHRVANHVQLREKVRITNTRLRSVKYFSEDELDQMERSPLLYFNHMWGLSRWDVQNLPELEDRVLIGAKIDTQARRNVAVWMEFRDYPFFGTQFHPEKRAIAGANPFDQSRSEVDEDAESESDCSSQGDCDMSSYSHEKKAIKSFFNLGVPTQGLGSDRHAEEGRTGKTRSGDPEIPESANNNSETKDSQDNLKSFQKDDSKKSGPEGKEASVSGTEKNQNIEDKKNMQKDSIQPKSGEKRSVDKVARPVVDSRLVPREYLDEVQQINRKFARFFGQFVGNQGARVDERFLEKQIFWLNNIGSYYQINVIKDNS